MRKKTTRKGKEMSEGMETSLEIEDGKVERGGAFDAKWDMEGAPICALCGHSVSGSFAEHLEEVHATTLAKYTEQFPEWPLVKRSDVGSSLGFHEREKKMFSVEQTFGFWWSRGKDKLVQGYAEAGHLTPKIDPNYVFEPELTQVALAGLHMKDKILMFGPTGSGKTSIWEQIAARLNFNFVRINFDAGITRSDLVGMHVVKGKSMTFEEGILPTGMSLPGTIICFDEWDTASEEVSFVLQRPLESNSQLLLLEDNKRIVKLHKENVIVATANTAGMGDDTGLYSGTRQQNYSQINRFSLTIETNYLPEKDEVEILERKFGSASEGKTIDSDILKAMVRLVNAVREAHTRGELSVPLSTRDLINWGEKMRIWGSPQKSAKYCFVNRYPLEDREVVEALIKRIFV